MTFPSVKSKVHLSTDDTVTYLVVECTVDCLQLQQDLLSLETGNRIKKWISVSSNVENRVCAHARRQKAQLWNTGRFHTRAETDSIWKDDRRIIRIEHTSEGQTHPSLHSGKKYMAPKEYAVGRRRKQGSKVDKSLKKRKRKLRFNTALY